MAHAQVPQAGSRDSAHAALTALRPPFLGRPRAPCPQGIAPPVSPPSYLPIFAASQVVGAGAATGAASRASTPRASRSFSA